MENRPSWSSQFAFTISTIGSAIGLGNIWRFPYIMGQNGGAIFLIVYLVLIMTLCFIPLMAELSLGKITKKESVGAFEQVNPKFTFFGWLNSVTAIMICAFYFVVGGWILNYIYKNLINFQITDYAQYFSAFTQNTVVTCVLTFVFLAKNIDDILPTIVSRSQCFYVPSFKQNDYNYSDVAGIFKNYWTFERSCVFDVSQKLIDISKSSSTLQILEQLQNYIFCVLKQNPKNTRFINDLHTLEFCKKQALADIKAQNIFDELCLKLIK